MPEPDKERIADKQIKRIKEKIKVIKTGTGTAGAHDAQHSKENKSYKGRHRG